MKKIFIPLVLLFIFIGLFFTLNNYIYKEKQSDNLPVKTYQATLTGKQTCLPHKNTSASQTLECATGIQTESGEYYALDLNQVIDGTLLVQNNETFTATGTITPIENLSSDNWQKYDVQGIFSVSSFVVTINEEETPPTKPVRPKPTPEIPVQKECYVGGCSSQLCGEEPGMMSTCEYREEYACYQSAICERQTDGKCGWTETEELMACLGK